MSVAHNTKRKFKKMSEDFKWTDDSVCISRVNATAVYINSINNIVIRQEGIMETRIR